MTGKQPKRNTRPGVDEYGRTPLHYAALAGDLAKVEALLAEGQDPDAQDDSGWTPLHFAAQERQLGAGADAWSRNQHGRSPYDMAHTIKHGLEKLFGTPPEGAG